MFNMYDQMYTLTDVAYAKWIEQLFMCIVYSWVHIRSPSTATRPLRPLLIEFIQRRFSISRSAGESSKSRLHRSSLNDLGQSKADMTSDILQTNPNHHAFILTLGICYGNSLLRDFDLTGCSFAEQLSHILVKERTTSEKNLNKKLETESQHWQKVNSFASNWLLCTWVHLDVNSQFYQQMRVQKLSCLRTLHVPVCHKF